MVYGIDLTSLSYPRRLDLGESCGSQLHVWSDILNADPVTSVTILATTRCREELVCLNSTCQDLRVNLEPATSPPVKQIPASHDDRREEDAVYLTRKSQPCHAKSERTISSFPFDEPVGRVATIDRGSKRFGIVYTAEFRNELDVLLAVIDVWQDDFFVDEESLISDFMKSCPEEDINGRIKRELESTPNNIQDILIRGASAHQEYVGGAQNQAPKTEVADRNSETVNLGDESTVRVHITTHPGKVQTLIDVVEGNGTEEGDGADLGNSVRLLSPPEVKEGEFSSGMLLEPLPTPAIVRSKPVETARVVNTNINNDSSLNETLMTFDYRLTLVEARIDLLGRVFEEMGRYSNLGSFTRRDCFVAQNSDLSYRRQAPDPEEQLTLASALDAVRVPESRRRVDHGLVGYRGWNEPRRQNPFRSMINDGYLPRRRPASGRWGVPPCKDRANLRSTRDVNPLQQETQIPVPRDFLPSWKMFIFDEKSNKGNEEESKKLTKRSVPKLFNGDNEESPVRTASGRLLFRDSDTPQLTTESIPEVGLISVNPDHGLLATNSYSITNHGNSRIRIEEIGKGDYDESLSQFHEIRGPSTAPEDGFDRIYDGVEAEEADGGFDYDHLEYGGVITGPPLGHWDKPETGLKWDAIRSVLHGRESDRRDRRNDGRECGRPAKRESPLLLFGSAGTNDPRTILWPSKWAGYRRDRIQVGEETTVDPGSIAITTTKPLYAETRTTPESLITGDGIKDEGSRTVTTKTSGFERRGRKNRRKLAWR